MNGEKVVKKPTSYKQEHYRILSWLMGKWSCSFSYAVRRVFVEWWESELAAPWRAVYQEEKNE